MHVTLLVTNKSEVLGGYNDYKLNFVKTYKQILHSYTQLILIKTRKLKERNQLVGFFFFFFGH